MKPVTLSIVLPGSKRRKILEERDSSATREEDEGK